MRRPPRPTSGRPVILESSARCTRRMAATVLPSFRVCARRRAPTTRLSTRTTGLTALPFRPCCRFCAALKSATSALTCLSRTTCTRRFTRVRIRPLVTSLPCLEKRSLPGTRSAISVWTRICSCTACAIARMCCASPTCPCRRTRSMWTTSTPTCRCRVARPCTTPTSTSIATLSVVRARVSTRPRWSSVWTSSSVLRVS